MNILIADDHAVIRRGLKQILLEAFPAALIEEAVDAASAIKLSLSGKWDVIISDLSMPGRSGLDVVHSVKENFPKIPVLILSIHPEEQYAIRSLKAGAAGYLSKDTAPEELVSAVRHVMQGRKYISAAIAEKLAAELYSSKSSQVPHENLSDREFDVFKMIAVGQSVSEIAEQMSLSVTTVSTYRARILGKMNLKSNADLTRYALDNGLI